MCPGAYTHFGRHIRRRLVLANFVSAAALAAYVYLLFWGPSTEEEGGLVFMVVAQKLIVYGSILNLGWQALGFRRALNSAAGEESAPVPLAPEVPAEGTEPAFSAAEALSAEAD